MATKKMYRVLDLEHGRITMETYVYSNQVALDEMEFYFDNELKEEHREQIIEAIDKKVQSMHAELVMLATKKKQLLAITHVSEPLKDGDVVKDDDIPF